MQTQSEVKEFEEKIIALDRVTRVVKGGRRFRFRATVVVGDRNGRVGVGVGKGRDVQTSIAKAVATAKKSMISFVLNERTINHEIQVRYGGAIVLLKPARPGTGVIAGGAVRSVVEVAGIHDLLTKSLGSSNKINNAYATIQALTELQNDQPAIHQPPKLSQVATVPTSTKPEKAVAKSPKSSTAAKSAAKKPATATTKKPINPSAIKKAKK